MSKFFKAALCLLVLSWVSSCYRMPNEDEYSLIPSTNNPDYYQQGTGKGKNQQKGSSMPGVNL